MVTLVNGDYPSEWFDAAIAARTVGMDIETNGLDKTQHKIATVQMFVPGKGTVMVRNFDSPITMLRILENRHITKIFHHAPFDLGFLMYNYPIYPESIADTKIAAKILDPKKTMFYHPDTNKGSHALISLVHHFFNVRLDKSLTVSDWFAPELSPEQLDYAAKDVEFLPELLRLLEVQLAKIRKVKLARKTMANVPTYVMLQLKNYDDIYSYT